MERVEDVMNYPDDVAVGSDSGAEADSAAEADRTAEADLTNPVLVFVDDLTLDERQEVAGAGVLDKLLLVRIERDDR